MSISRILGTNTESTYPIVAPELNLDFINNISIDPAYTFTRNSSGTYIDADGYIKTAGVNQPRFDHDPLTGECKGLIIEEKRTNIFLRSSNYLTAFAYQNYNVGTDDDGTYGIFWDGDTKGYQGRLSPFDNYSIKTKVSIGSTLSLSRMRTPFDLPIQSSTTYTLSFLYRNSLDRPLTQDIRLGLNNTGFGLGSVRIVDFNSPDKTIDEYKDGWKRISFTMPRTLFVAQNIIFDVYRREDREQVFEMIDFQLEAGTTPTSYIPTTNTTVTRQPEQLVLNNAPISNQGTFFIESNPTVDSTSFVADNGTSSLPINSPLNQHTKSVLYYNTNRTLRMSSGNNTPVDINANPPQDLNRISLGFNRLYSINYINGHIKKFSYYANPLTEDNLRAITSNKVSIFRSNDGPIVTNGLVLYLDAGNPVSYPGSGTTWTDLSGNVNNGTLVNGVGYDSGNGGSLSFDGDNDYVEIIGNASNTPSSMTLFCFIYPENTRPEEIIAVQNNGLGYRFMTRVYANNNGTAWGFRPSAGGTEWSASVLSNNTWYCLAVTYTTTNLKLYKNAVVELNTGSPGTLTHGGNIRLGDGIGLAQGHLQGNLPVFMMYNRALSPQEIQQNFNALRGRFGI